MRFAEASFLNYLVDWVVYYEARIGIRIAFLWLIITIIYYRAAIVARGGSAVDVWNIRGRASYDNRVKPS